MIGEMDITTISGREKAELIIHALRDSGFLQLMSGKPKCKAGQAMMMQEQLTLPCDYRKPAADNTLMAVSFMLVFMVIAGAAQLMAYKQYVCTLGQASVVMMGLTGLYHTV